MKTVYILCHYFPPDKSVGVRRALYWSEKFSSLGYKVKIITTKKANASHVFKEIGHKIEVYEYGFFSFNPVLNLECENMHNDLHEPSTSKRNSIVFELLRRFKQKVFNRYFGQLLDNRLLFVLPFLFRLLFFRHHTSHSVFKESEEESIIISTAPPWPSHLIAVALKSIYRHKLIIDYRDPFYGNHVFSQNMRYIEKKIDSFICRNADVVTTVSPSWVEHYRQFHDSVILIRNGYDEKIMSVLDYPWKNDVRVSSVNGKISFGYFGSIEVESRIPYNLIELVISNNEKYTLNFYGRCSLAKDYIEGRYGSYPTVFFHGLIEYDLSLKAMAESSINVVAESSGSTLSEKGLVPTKIYEYIRVQKPILSIMSSNSDSLKIIEESGLLLKNCSPKEDLSTYLEELDQLVFKPSKVFIESLSRESSFNKLMVSISEIRGCE